MRAPDRARPGALDDKALKAQRTKPDEHTALLFQKGSEFEAAYLADLKREAQSNGDLVGHADFLRKVPRPSALGNYSYEVIVTKLSRKPKASYVLQLAFYGDLLTKAQQLDPHAMHVVLGTREQVRFTCNEYSRYFRRLLGRFTSTVSAGLAATKPKPFANCPQCHWQDHCNAQLAVEDSLHQVAGIRASQVQKLEAAGIHTLKQLAQLEPAHTVPHVAAESFAKLRDQAAMQQLGRDTGKPQFKLIESPSGIPTGLLREKRLVDLYRVTRISIRASTSSYSIKDIEALYRGKRSGDVQFARRELSFVRAYLPQLPRVVDTGAMV